MSRAPRLPWCGQCDEDTRLVDVEEGLVARCHRCHAGAQATKAGRGQRNHRRARVATDTSETCPACGERILRTHRCRATALDPTSPVAAASVREITLALGEVAS